MKSDYHIHTFYCGHAKGSVKELVRASIQLQLGEICFTDHLPRYYLTDEEQKKYWDWCMPAEFLDSYVSDVLQAKKDYPEITIKLGIEADFVDGEQEKLKNLLDQYPFDFILGSIHCLPPPKWKHAIEYQEAVKTGQMDVFEIYERFFNNMEKAAQSKIFSCLAHPDFVWRYFPWPNHKNDETLFLMEHFVKSLAAIKETCIEANARGIVWTLDKGEQDNNYMKDFFFMVAKHGVPVTVGSDAHRPLQIAECFGELTDFLKRMGIKKVAIFDQKKMRMEKMN